MSDPEPQVKGLLAGKIKGGHGDAVAVHGSVAMHLHGRRIKRPGGKGLFLQRLQPLIAQRLPFLGRGGHGRRRCLRHKLMVDPRVALVLGQVREDTQGLGIERFPGCFIRRGHGIRALQKTLEPMEGTRVERLHILVRTFRDLKPDLVFRSHARIEAAGALVELKHARNWKNRILVRIAHQQRSRCHQAHHPVVVPAIRVHHEHAVAVSFHTTVHHVVFQTRDAGGGCRRLDALIQRRDPP